LAGAALLCFAANSILCRLALAPKLIDPATFTSVRVLSAAAMLTAAVLLRSRRLPRIALAIPRSIAAVFAYLIFFSFAYMRLGAATGALILIAGVQLTMFFAAWREGETFSLVSWAGVGLAFFGVLYLLLPGVSAPDPWGAALMAISGVAWGIFSLVARGAAHPVETNGSNLLGCLLPAAVVNLLFAGDFSVTVTGLAFAIASGAVATGFGYILWYLALRHLSAASAAIVQLSMPAVVALGGVAFLAEPLSLRLVIASGAMLGGIAIVLAQRSQPAASMGKGRNP
jgi:drug/metabolite transporter (DMT)-like permease